MRYGLLGPTVLLSLVGSCWGAVLPPPWANPKLNPCATQPGGWQLLFWPPDGKCYKIFKTGYPCSDDMELSPSPTKSGQAQQNFSAECRCPPKKAQSAKDGKCYDLYSNGPCEQGFYFAPDTKYNSNNSNKRLWGVCDQMKKCGRHNDIFWPKNGKCYQRLNKGPCTRGLLITLDPDRGIAQCKCGNRKDLRDYRYAVDGSCYQHFTRGPCKEKGHLFLPDRTCGCHSFLPHYHDETELCYEIGKIGPCGLGENYQLHPDTRRGTCQCKPGYIRHLNTTSCYRPFTQGPCRPDHILVDSTKCIPQPCPRGHLYFHDARTCHRIGTRGPCSRGRVVTFDYDTRPSVDGISYNGVCDCVKRLSGQCDDKEDYDKLGEGEIVCDKSGGLVLFNGKCYKLYTQGPCDKGAWLVAKRQGKDFDSVDSVGETLWSDLGDVNNDRRNGGVCDCVPGYTRSVVRTVKEVEDGGGVRSEVSCVPPAVILAEYLNSSRNVTSTQIVKLL